MWRFASAGAAALGFMLAFLPLAREAAAQTIGQPIRLHSADQRVNVVTDHNQSLKFQAGTAVAALAPSSTLPQGGFVVVWMSHGQDGSGSGIFARRYAADGTALDLADIQVNVVTASEQEYPSVAARQDGGFVVVWQSMGQDGSGSGIFARRFAADGTALDVADLPVNVYVSDDQVLPAVAARPDGSFVVSWTSWYQDGSGNGIFARRFSADGTPLDAADIPVNVHTTDGQQNPAIASRPDGSFVVAWMSFLQDGAGWGIFARRFAADGTALDATDLPVNVTTTNDQFYPAIAARPDGSFVVTWMSYAQDGSEWGIFARRFDADGTALDVTEIAVNVTVDGYQESPSLGVRPDGSFVVTWMSRQTGEWDVFARRFAANGIPFDAADVSINVTTDAGQGYPSIATLPDGETMVVVWQGNGPGDFQGIFMNRFRVAGKPIARNDMATVTQPGSVVINVLANDVDPDVGDTLTVDSVSTPAGGGSVIINGDNTLTYTPASGCGYAGDNFTYKIRDSTGKEAIAFVSVTITQAPLMTVSPTTGLRLYGQQGGPFSPPHGTYTVSNTGCANLNWDMTRSATWVGRTPVSGSLGPGASTSVSVFPGTGTPSLPTGEHRATARFRNLSNGMGTTDRVVILRVLDAFGSNGFSAARLLSGASGVTWGSNIGATGQVGEPDHAGVSLPLASVWWSWTAPASGRVIFHTVGSTFDTVLAVYTGTAINALTLVAANDDDAALAPQSRVAFNAVAGTTYRIVVDGKGDATGQVRLNWSMR